MSTTFLANLQSIAGKAPRQFSEIEAGFLPKKRPQAVDFAKALELGAFHDTHAQLAAISEDGVVDWDRFDIADFVPYITSIATFEQTETPDGEIDFIYRVAGENINRVAKRNLRGCTLREVLIGPNRNVILTEYIQTLAERRPSASRGSVDISDLTWVHYLRFLYPVRRHGAVRHLLNFMLFASSARADTRFSRKAI